MLTTSIKFDSTECGVVTLRLSCSTGLTRTEREVVCVPLLFTTSSFVHTCHTFSCYFKGAVNPSKLRLGGWNTVITNVARLSNTKCAGLLRFRPHLHRADFWWNHISLVCSADRPDGSGARKHTFRKPGPRFDSNKNGPMRFRVHSHYLRPSTDLIDFALGARQGRSHLGARGAHMGARGWPPRWPPVYEKNKIK